MERQNVTLSIPRPLLIQAKILAASQDKSLSQFLRESLEEKVREGADYDKARIRQKRLLKNDETITFQKSLYILMANIFALIFSFDSTIFFGKEINFNIYKIIKERITLRISTGQKSLTPLNGVRRTLKAFVR